jgi:hypothetical protein
MKILIAALLILHGLIVIGQSSCSFNPVGGVKNPSWLSWWPSNLGQSWLLSGLGIQHSVLARAGGVLWLAAGIALVAAGLSVVGLVLPTALWPSLALTGAVISLVMLIIYLHPFYGIGICASIVLLAALVWEQWPLLERLGL